MSNVMTYDVTGLKPVPMSKKRGIPIPGAFRYFRGDDLIAKTCLGCGEVKPSDDFHSKSRGDGLVAQCKLCVTRKYVYNREARKEYYLANREVRLEYSREYRRNNPSMRRERLRSRTPEEVLVDQKRLRPDDMKCCRRCRNIKPLSSFYSNISRDDGLVDSCKPCRARKKWEIRTGVHMDYWESVGIPLECYICAGSYEEVEHVWCQSSGGPDVPENTLPVCAECNHGQGGKHTQMLFTYLWERFGVREAGEILRRVTMEYGVWPFDQPYVAEDWA